MLPKIPMIAAAGVFLYVSPALADTPAPTAHASKASDPNEKVCQDIVMTGSRIAKQRICATKSEWKAMMKEDEDLADEMRHGRESIIGSGKDHPRDKVGGGG